VDGSDGIEIEWFHNDVKLLESQIVHMQGRKLIMDNLKIDEIGNGYFHCVAHQKAGPVYSPKAKTTIWWPKTHPNETIVVNEGTAVVYTIGGEMEKYSEKRANLVR
jgi:hypothetical protein